MTAFLDQVLAGAVKILSISGLVLGVSLNSHAQTQPSAKTSDRYNPAVLKLIYSVDPTKPNSSVLDTILIPVQGEAIARRFAAEGLRYSLSLAAVRERPSIVGG